MKTVFNVLVLVIAVCAEAQVPAFPGAWGGGMYTTGGRGGRILFVDNLNDKGDGSLRKAIEAEGPRTVVFRVSGNIELSKMLHIKNNDLTIAGQTAPGEGICLVNYGIRLDADNVNIRYIRIRPGNHADDEIDAISCIGHSNIIIDHCSFSWANDEVASFYDNTNFTLQWCIISESLYNSGHHKGVHGYGGIWGGNRATFHNNLISDHTSRTPRLNGARYHGNSSLETVDFRNNVIYNWGFNSIYGGEGGNYNLVNNYYKPGPATRSNKRNRILELTRSFYNKSFYPDTIRAGKFFISGNRVEGSRKASRRNWKFGVEGSGADEAAKRQARLTQPVSALPVKTTSALVAYRMVLQNAGASLFRDAVDQRIVEEAKTGTESFGKSYEEGQNGIIDSQDDVGGWPVLRSKQPPADSDSDGLPDHWEEANNLNPKDDSDMNSYSLDEDYTNLEVYINSLVK